MNHGIYTRMYDLFDHLRSGYNLSPTTTTTNSIIAWPSTQGETVIQRLSASNSKDSRFVSPLLCYRLVMAAGSAYRVEATAINANSVA